MSYIEEDFEYNIDASTFQTPLIKLAEVLAQKVKREAPKLLSAPPFVAIDLHVMIRQAMHTYDLFFYLNADDRRENDCHWKNAYTIVALPLIRNMIDCLYNITFILQNPDSNGSLFRASGFRKAMAAFAEDERRYGGQQKWDSWIKKNRDGLDFAIRECGMTMDDILAERTPWPTLGKYISDRQPGGTITAHQDFLKTFVYGRWREYSAMSHGAFEGLLHVAMYYIADSMPHEDRPKLEKVFAKILSSNILRAALLLLCIVTELQAYFHFDDDGARINQRIHEIWNALMPAFEAKELYDERYAKLMAQEGIIG